MKATNLSLKALKGTGARRDVTVDGYSGLRVRVSPDASKKAWQYVYRQAGRLHRLTLGDWPEFSITEATELHGRMRRLALDGDDPRKALPDRRPVSRKVDGFTVRELAEEFRDRHLQANVKTWAETWRLVEKDVLPEWGERDASTITPREVVLLLDGIMDRGAERVANRVRSVLFQMFRFGVSRGMVSASPVVAVERPSKKTGTRERILTDVELRKLWTAIDTASMLPRLAPALRLLLVTGQRRGEVALARWSEFNLEARLWTIPGERTKNGREHTVPLSDLAMGLLQDLRESLGDYEGPWLFPSPHHLAPGEERQSVDPKAITRAVSRNRAHWGIPPFTVHDLRRTVRSNLSALGISPIVARKVVNHTLEGMDAIYDRHDYLDEKRQALELWGGRLQSILHGSHHRVRPIREARP